MEILIIANNDIGLFNFRKELIEALLSSHFVHIALPYGEKVEELKNIGCKYHEIEMDRRSTNVIHDFKLMMKIRKLIKEIDPDYVITYTIKPNVYGGMACRSLRVPYVANVTGLGTAFQRDGLLKRFVTFLYKVGLKDSRVVFFENQTNRQVFLENRIVPSEKTHVLNGAGVNTEKFAYLPYPEQDERIHFLFIGRIMKEKGIDELLSAFHKLQNNDVKADLTIIGDCEEDYLEQLRKTDYSDWLFYQGFQKDVIPFLEKTDCLILPSWHEGMANTILEASSSGRPVIASNIPGCRESVEDGKTGFLCEKQSVEDLYRAILQFIAQPYEVKADMGKQARKKMIQEFDKKEIVAETISEIEKRI